jgi:phage terminase large subunit
MSQMAPDKLIHLSPKQTIALQKLADPEVNFLLYGGAKGGGKSVFGCYWLFFKCLDLIEKFNLEATQYPIPVAFMGRKQSVDFNDTTLETWKTNIPADYYSLSESNKEITIQGAVKIQFGGLDDSNTVKKFNSAEYCYLFIDQAEEISRDDFGLLRGTLRRKLNGEEADYKGLFTANPAICWLKDVFITQKDKGCEFIQALPSDNPFIAAWYVENLREAFKHRPELIKAYVEGDWDVMSGHNLVIKPSWVEKAKQSKTLHETYKRRLVCCDPARFGDNETVIYVMQGPQVIHQEIYGQRSTMETAGLLVALKNKFNADLIAIDSCGIGGGIVDRLAELREPHVGIDVGSSATEDKYRNLRSQVVWEAADYFAKENIVIPDDATLSKQLLTLTYEMQSNGKILIRSKEEIKKQLSGQSCDRADALLLGLYALKMIPEVNQEFFRMPPTRTRANSYGWQQGQAINV